MKTELIYKSLSKAYLFWLEKEKTKPCTAYRSKEKHDGLRFLTQKNGNSDFIAFIGIHQIGILVPNPPQSVFKHLNHGSKQADLLGLY